MKYFTLPDVLLRLPVSQNRTFSPKKHHSVSQKNIAKFNLAYLQRGCINPQSLPAAGTLFGFPIVRQASVSPFEKYLFIKKVKSTCCYLFAFQSVVWGLKKP